ncbi:hypothetical protein J4050_09530 [Winogradskyella sp. DF17]|uniref:T9SS C-terminal target domain-containing protein n=1 Tax=Winogradskyella pelagia TaxID=2819984 RepID=A0ABS3T3F3_9FLAO|nr:hypothetical protein [Winogradskyella sp. DF17]MBO3116989.1 hypothetical protein [Winogradskyella sp. DF17]
MKTLLKIAVFFICASTTLSAQQEKGIIGYNNWLNNWTDFRPSQKTYGEPTQILSGTITEDTKLTKNDVYLLLGDVFVSNNANLIIEAGTVILGDFKTKGSLTISKGSKLIAEGTQTDPIIFTSSRGVKKAGDWGGLFILGDAPTNMFGNAASLEFGLRPASFDDISYGGSNKDSNSGVIRFVRIEFAGKKTKDFGNYNGLTLAGIGHETVIENVMVSYCEGNSFSILGGQPFLMKMVSFRANQNDYVFNYGAQTEILNSLAIRSPYVSSPYGSRCMVIQSYDDKETSNSTKEETVVNAENLTLINVSDNLTSDIEVGLVKEAIFVDENTAFAIDKSVISGFYPAVYIDEDIRINNESLEKIQFTRTYFNNCKGNIFVKGFSNNDDLENWYGSRVFNNVYSRGPDSETFIEAHSSKRPDYRLRINKIIASNDIDDDDDD